ncbi:MAG: rRNA maturation RNase YbeY [Bradyrhizobium sp.]|nr:MAG: rRNA maturation RNase YbeY [Bradyrhizobium sp.]
MRPKVEFVALSPRWRALPARALAREAIAASIAECDLGLAAGAELCIHLADDAHLRGLNARWRGIDKPTNVLSFPAFEPSRLAQARLLGDIALAYETLAREAEDEGKPLADHYRHLVVHGFLHLVGFDHENDADAERMEATETRILARLGVADPYRAEALAESAS